MIFKNILSDMQIINFSYFIIASDLKIISTNILITTFNTNLYTSTLYFIKKGVKNIKSLTP